MGEKAIALIKGWKRIVAVMVLASIAGCGDTLRQMHPLNQFISDDLKFSDYSQKKVGVLPVAFERLAKPDENLATVLQGAVAREAENTLGFRKLIVKTDTSLLPTNWESRAKSQLDLAKLGKGLGLDAVLGITVSSYRRSDQFGPAEFTVRIEFVDTDDALKYFILEDIWRGGQDDDFRTIASRNARDKFLAANRYFADKSPPVGPIITILSPTESMVTQQDFVLLNFAVRDLNDKGTITRVAISNRNTSFAKVLIDSDPQTSFIGSSPEFSSKDTTASNYGAHNFVELSVSVPIAMGKNKIEVNSKNRDGQTANRIATVYREPPSSKNWLVAVNVNKYNYMKITREHDRGGDQFSNAVTLLQQSLPVDNEHSFIYSDESATLKTFGIASDHITEDFRRDDHAVVYFSGVVDVREYGVLLAFYDTEPQFRSTLRSIDSLVRIADRSRLTTIIDGCTIDRTDVRDKPRVRSYQDSLVALRVCSSNTKSLADILVEILATGEGDLNGDGKITILEFAEFVRMTHPELQLFNNIRANESLVLISSASKNRKGRILQ
jgi:hypothetical protein